MNCEEIEKDLVEFLDKTLDERRMKEIQRHLEGCERCSDELIEMQQLVHAMSSEELKQPHESLRTNFYHMLHNEVHKQKHQIGKPKIHRTEFRSVWVKVAAGLALLITGAFGGILFQNYIKPGGTVNEINQMKTEVASIREMMMLKMLDEESPSERIKAVNYAEEIPEADEGVLNALVKTMNRDKNVNVRLAAAYSLAKFADRKQVRDSMVQSLTLQTDPIIQIVLMNILVEKKEKSAVKSIQQVMSNKNTLKEVKEAAQKSIRVLL